MQSQRTTAWYLVRAELVLAILAVVAAIVAWIGMPSYSSGMFNRPWWRDDVRPLGVAGTLLGLAWTWWIGFRNREPRGAQWRWQDSLI